MSKLDETLIKRLPPFSRLTSVQVREALDLSSTNRWAEGHNVFDQGASASRFFLLLDGTIRVVKVTTSGSQIIPLHIPSGELFGIASAFSIDAYPASAVAACECLTLSWPARHWSNFVAQYEGFSTETWRTVGVRIGELHDRIDELSTKAVEHRIAAVLLRLISQYGRSVDDGIEVIFPITRATMSEMAGTTLHTASRLLSAWERKGIVASKRRHITVTDPHQLVLIAEAN